MKKVMFFVAALCCSTILFAQNASWMGKSYLVVAEKWYNVSNGDDTSTDPLPESIGSVSALNIGGQVQSYGDDDGEHNPAFMSFRFDELSEWHEIELKWFKYEGDPVNNNFFGVGGEGEKAFPVVAAEGFDALANGEHTLEFYFYKPSGSSDSKVVGGKLYDSNGGANFKVKFTKSPSTAIDHIVGNAASLKVMENGVLYIYRNDVKYDAQGKAVR